MRAMRTCTPSTRMTWPRVATSLQTPGQITPSHSLISSSVGRQAQPQPQVESKLRPELGLDLEVDPEVGA